MVTHISTKWAWCTITVLGCATPLLLCMDYPSVVFICLQSGLSLGGADGLVHGVTLSADDNVSIVTTENGDMIQVMSDAEVNDAIDHETAGVPQAIVFDNTHDWCRTHAASSRVCCLITELWLLLYVALQSVSILLACRRGAQKSVELGRWKQDEIHQMIFHG